MTDRQLTSRAPVPAGRRSSCVNVNQTGGTKSHGVDYSRLNGMRSRPWPNTAFSYCPH